MSKSNWVKIIVAGILSLAVVGGVVSFASAERVGPYVATDADRDLVAKADAYTEQVAKAQAELNAPNTLLPLPDRAKVLIFGDAWTRGRGADNPEAEGYAPLLARMSGWDAMVAGEGGTGYLNPGSGNQVPYTERARTIAPPFTPDLIILQGGQSDGNQDIGKLPDAINATIDTFNERFPNAQLLMVGPGPANTAAINAALSNAANAKKIPYIDSIAAGWMTGTNATTYMLPDFTPNTDGHAWLARNIKESIASLTKKP